MAACGTPKKGVELPKTKCSTIPSCLPFWFWNTSDWFCQDNPPATERRTAGLTIQYHPEINVQTATTIGKNMRNNLTTPTVHSRKQPNIINVSGNQTCFPHNLGVLWNVYDYTYSSVLFPACLDCPNAHWKSSCISKFSTHKKRHSTTEKQLRARPHILFPQQKKI